MVADNNTDLTQDYQAALSALEALAKEQEFTPAQTRFLKMQTAIQFFQSNDDMQELCHFLEASGCDRSQIELVSSFNPCFCSSGLKRWYYSPREGWKCRNC